MPTTDPPPRNLTEDLILKAVKLPWKDRPKVFRFGMPIYYLYTEPGIQVVAPMMNSPLLELAPKDSRLVRFNDGNFGGARWIQTRSGKIRPVGPRRAKAKLRRVWSIAKRLIPIYNRPEIVEPFTRER